MVRWPVQIVNLTVIVAIMAVQVVWIRNNRSEWRWSVPVLVWMVHSAIFYLFVLLPDIPMTNWSAVLRLHGYLSVLMTEIARARLSRRC